MSELYAAVLVIGVTLSFGSIVVAAAGTQFGAEGNASSLGSSLAQTSAGIQVGLVYAAVSPSLSCPQYRSFNEGTSLTLALYDFGSAPLSPAGLVVNSTVYVGGFPTVPAGGMAQVTLTLTSCAHSSGQTVVMFDSAGDEAQIET